MPPEFNVLDSVSPDFFKHSIFSVDPFQVLIVRLYGGVPILRRNNIGQLCKVVLFDEDRLPSLRISDSCSGILAIKCLFTVLRRGEYTPIFQSYK